jgi:XRE family transcriptional regulator, thiamine biosynthesis regulator
MTLRLPDEIVVDRFLPTFRAMFAADLAERGLTQREIAAHLGVTQAAVSKQLAGEVAIEPRFAEDRRVRRGVEEVGSGLASGTLDSYEALATVLALIEELEDRGPICAVHEEEMPELEGLGCDLCVRGPDAERLDERAVLGSVRTATRLLEATPVFAAHIPKVGTNVGMALPGASDPIEVAAIPGRIFEMRGRVRVPADPEFGGSEHVATAILAAHAVDPEIRGALNLATDDGLLEAADRSTLDVLEFDAGYDDRGERLRELFETEGVPAVAFHRGAFGIEPICYVFGESAEAAAERAIALVSGL